MRLTRQKVIFTLSCLIVVICFSVFAVPRLLDTRDSYSGELSFGMEGDYADFENALIDSDAQWAKMEVLSFSPPIIVHFEVRVDQDYDFPYGEKGTNWPWALGLSIFGLLVAIAIATAFPGWEWTRS